MYHYLFTNDLRISVLDESLKKAGHCFSTNTVPSSSVDKSTNNNMMTLGFYFNLNEKSHCARIAAAGNSRAVVLNFIKKFQFPNMRTTAAFENAKKDGITLVPMRVIVKLLYTMNLLHGKQIAQLSKDEIKIFIFYNDAVAKNKNPDIGQLINDILEYRKSNVLPISVSTEEETHEWKHEDRQIREMLKILQWSGCITERDGKYTIDNDELSSQNKADVFDIITCDTFWSGSTIESYREYMDMPEYMISVGDNIANVENEIVDIEESNKRLFRYWLELQVKPEGDSDAGNPYSKNSIDAYVSNVGNTKLANEPDKSVYFTTDVGEVKATIEVLDKEDKKNNTQRSAVRKYLEYIMNLAQESEDYDEILKHNLWGIHMKEKNTALSDENPHICIGWSDMGDLSELKTVDEILEVYDQYFSDRNNRARGQEVGMIRRFLKDLQIGDYVIFAEASEFHIGRIESDYYFDSTDYDGQSTDYKNTRKVKWLKKHISRKDISKAMHNSLATAMSIFGINDYRAAVVDLLRGTYRKDDDIIDSPVEPVNLVFQTTVELPYDNNRIVFGAPGTGKSYQLKKDSENVIKTHNAELERVTFHPDYSYSQFVGTYKPVMDEDGEKIKYQYVPGPFMRVLVKALKSAMTSNPKPYILIIEEINRAKVAAVFGEVFQLLDRDEDGISEYDIQASEDIRRYLSEEIGGNPTDFDRIRIPNNMYIWATMNSADQGVFPMDTAFKRRWNFEYLGINESEKYIQGVGKIMLPGSDEPVEWNMIRKAINDKMSSSDFKINEDKLMGPFFLSQKMFISDEDGMIINPKRFVSAFKSKVIMYLYEDAVKQGKHRFFEGCNASKYSSVCEAFDEIGMGIFGATFKENYYDKQRNDA